MDTVHSGILFIWLFLGLAPGVALLLLSRSARLAMKGAKRRGKILLVAAAVLAVWAGASYIMSELTFATAWGIAHTRPLPAEMFPEGSTIYGFLAAYSLLGAALFMALGRVLGRLTFPDRLRRHELKCESQHRR